MLRKVRLAVEIMPLVIVCAWLMRGFAGRAVFWQSYAEPSRAQPEQARFDEAGFS
jgi:hypothetical protein